MSYSDMGRNIERAQSIAPAAITATTTGEEVDLSGVLDCMILVDVGVISAADANNYMTFTVTQATATGGSFSAADSAQYGAIDSWDLVLNATTEGSQTYAFNFFPKADYPIIKVVATETSTFDGIFGATALFTKTTQPANS